MGTLTLSGGGAAKFYPGTVARERVFLSLEVGFGQSLLSAKASPRSTELMPKFTAKPS